MDDLVARLRACLDTDERVALAAGERGRTWNAPERDGDGRGAVEHDGKHYAPIVYDEGYPNEAESAHIARHDPARVLRWVKAAREILERHAPFKDTEHVPNEYAPRQPGEVNPRLVRAAYSYTSTKCSGCSRWTNMGEDHDPWPCPDFRALMSVYGDEAG